METKMKINERKVKNESENQKQKAKNENRKIPQIDAK